MKTFKNIFVLILILIAFAGVAAGETQVPIKTQEIIGAPPQEMGVPPTEVQDLNFTKLEINPRYTNFRLQPGDNREVTVTIKNKETKTVSVNPVVVIQPYGEFIMDKNWITITPESKEISAGASEKFVIKAVIPDDATPGYYNPMIVFTDEAYPSPYPSPVPNYVHTMSLSIDVWKTPLIQMTNQYINDQLEAGKEMDYKIKLKNTGNEPVAIDPKIAQDDMYYDPYGNTQAFTNDAVTLSGPKEIPAQSSAEVNIHIKVPVGAKGIYRGAIDLGIQDVSVRDPYMYRAQLEISVWTTPTEAYIKTFTSKEASALSIDVSSGMGMYYPSIQTSQKKKDPSFTVALTGSDNKEISLKKTKTVIKGGASLGSMMYAPWEGDSEGIYQEMGVQYIETYSTDIAPDEFKLSIMPQNTQQFEYTITMGNK